MATLALVAVVATGCGSAQPSSLSSLGFSSSGTPSPSAAEETPSEVAPSSPTAVPTAAAPAATFAGLPPKGTFSSPVSFVYPSQEYSATLFKDGRVLIAGGAGSTSGSYTWATLSVARLYSPADGAWVTPGKMTSVRQCHTATLLEDGRVLIAGGWTGSPDYTTLSSAEIYDPVTGQFSPTGAMATARCRAQAVRLADGRVLIAGGQSAGVYGLNTAEIYDPGTGKFSPTGPFATNYVEQCACDLYSLTVLGDGRVLMLGNVKPTDEIGRAHV